MPFCKNCGSEIDGESKFCSRCGTPVIQVPEPQSDENVPDLEKTMKRRAPGYRAVRPENLPEGFLLDDRYDVKRKLGQGGFGAVYLVHDGKMEGNKAVKVIPEAVLSDLEAMENLRREASTMLALNHPNIVRVYDFHDRGNIKFIDMEYVDGMSLTENKMKSPERKLPEDEVRKYALQIAEGLQYAHSKNILHKDIKPQNIMLTNEGNIKIMDFGIAETVRTSMSRLATASSSGTLVYMSPEQIRGKEVGKESDIYSFGVTLYELLSGNPPFYRGDITYQILNEEPEQIDGISPEMSDLIAGCLNKDYRKRYSGFHEIINKLGGKAKAVREKFPRMKKQSAHPLKGKKHMKLMHFSVVTEPPGATVWLDGKERKSPLKLKYPTGMVEVKIKKEGFEDIVEELDVSETGVNDFYFELISIKGSITIESDFPGLDIYFNGEKTAKKTPLTFDNLLPGEYKIILDGETHFSELEIVQLGKNASCSVQPRLVSYSYLKINSNYKDLTFNLFARCVPDRMDDRIDINPGENVKLKPGKYKLEPSLNYLPSTDGRLSEGEKRTLNYDDLIPTRSLTIKPGNRPFEVILTHIESGKKKNLSIKREEKIISLLPGMYDIETKDRMLSRMYNVELISEDKTINLIDIIQEIRVGNITFEMLYIPGGTFEMGSPESEEGRDKDEGPLHRVTVSPFFMSKYPVTQAFWKAVMEYDRSKFGKIFVINPSVFKGDNRPVECVTWEEAQRFCEKLSEITGRVYRLPTEAEREYACRAGSKSRFYFGGPETELAQYAWYEENSNNETHPVGGKKANAWGLFDMHGNVWEWCGDRFDEDYYSQCKKKGTVVDPRRPSSGAYRVIRGGGWSSYTPCGRDHDIGFRLARTP